MTTWCAAHRVNQIWAGHPGSQKLVGLGSNKQVEVWTKPLGNGRTAALFVNTAEKDARAAPETPKQVASDQAPALAVATTTVRYDYDDGGGLSLVKCDPEKPSQIWEFDVDGVMTNVKSQGGTKGCWEITGCSTHPGAHVGTSYGCKGLPKAGCSNLCACNGAWTANITTASASSGSDSVGVAAAMTVVFTSLMDGACLTVAGGSKVNVGPCMSGNPKQQFVLQSVEKLDYSTTGNGGGKDAAEASNSPPPPAYRITQGGMCVDDGSGPAPPGPPIPPPCAPPACTPGGPANVTVALSELELGITGSVKVRDVWQKQFLPHQTTTFTTSVPHHGCTFYIFMPASDTEWPLPFKLAPWMDKPAPPTVQ